MICKRNLVISSAPESKSLDYCFVLKLKRKENSENRFPEKHNNTMKWQSLGANDHATAPAVVATTMSEARMLATFLKQCFIPQCISQRLTYS